MKGPRKINFILSASKIISVNDLYAAKLVYKGSRVIPAMYKKDGAKKMEAYIKEQVSLLNIPVNHSWAKKDTLFKLNFTAVLKNGIGARDLDNLCKNLVDGIFRGLGYNDSHVYELHCYKTICPDIPEEKILVSLEEFVGEPRFDKVVEDKPVPTCIYLTGEKTEELEKKLKFEFRRGNQEDKDLNCDSHLYLLTPGEFTASMCTDMMDSVWEVRQNNYGSCIIGFLGTKEEWGEEAWGFIDKVNQRSCGSPLISASYIETPLDILDFYGKPKRRRKTNG